MNQKTINDLLPGVFPQISASIVTGITSDSREVTSGSVFVAIRGQSQDGHQYISLAQEQGAIAVLGELDAASISGLKVPYLKVTDGRLRLAQLAAEFYDNPSRSLLMIGVTGTSGKTTTTYLIESILKAADHRVGVIGTVNFRFGTHIYPSTHTTPGPVELQKLLSEMKKDGCTAVVMEVSSHALVQKRVASIAFDGTVFTNLSAEHLDFHPSMEDYFLAKKLLFTEAWDESKAQGKKPVAAINGLDSYGFRLIQELELKNSEFLDQSKMQFTLDGIEGQMDGISLRSSLTGQFNVSNIAGAVSVTHRLGIAGPAISNGIMSLPGVPGRLERVQNPAGIHIWVDYAHKPDALEKVLKTLREIRGNHRLITVVGCGGDRDRLKRPLMGKIATELSDWTFVTSDNPRTEDPMMIIREILVGIQGSTRFTVEADRRSAIHQAIRLSKKGDLILIAGKGHEDYQIIGKKKIHFDDREVAAEVFAQT